MKLLYIYIVFLFTIVASKNIEIVNNVNSEHNGSKKILILNFQSM